MLGKAAPSNALFPAVWFLLMAHGQPDRLSAWLKRLTPTIQTSTVLELSLDKNKRIRYATESLQSTRVLQRENHLLSGHGCKCNPRPWIYGAYISCNRAEFGSLNRCQPELCGRPTTLHLRARFGIRTRPEARNRMCITVNRKIYVFTLLQQLFRRVSYLYRILRTDSCDCVGLKSTLPQWRRCSDGRYFKLQDHEDHG
jgi:hypothetical protein